MSSLEEELIQLDDELLRRVTKPARYTGGEWNSVVKDWDSTPIRVALAFPDLYELGMSNLALPILYDILNAQPDVLAERVYAPWTDMEASLRQAGIPLFSLESRRPLGDFDLIGFFLGYELGYTNVLNLLDLAGIPVLASERDSPHPLVIAGGACCLNPEPMVDFVDFFVIGDGEEVVLELVDVLRESKKMSRREILRRFAAIPGVYVPSLYQVEYGADGLLKSFTPVASEAKRTIQRRIVNKLPPPLTRPVVPYIGVVHDRGMIEIQRGCTRGCRFCQAGVIYRPLRERPIEEIVPAVGELIAHCGYNEVSLLSLNTSEFSGIEKLVASLIRQYRQHNLGLSLPSLRINRFSVNLMESLPSQRKTGLTFAPEAGSDRLRQFINKNITEEEILDTLSVAFSRGWSSVKLYFMLGLPSETREDVTDILKLVDKIHALGSKTRRPQVRISLATFVPKSHTPFQWSPQEGEESLTAKYELLRQGLQRRGTKLSWQDPRVSLLEALLSRGDRRMGKVIYGAWKRGATFDAWGERFKWEHWQGALAEAGVDPGFYAFRERPLDEVLPWSHIDSGVTPAYLKREYRQAQKCEQTTDCRYELCSACGLQRWHPTCRERQKSGAAAAPAE